MRVHCRTLVWIPALALLAIASASPARSGCVSANIHAINAADLERRLEVFRGGDLTQPGAQKAFDNLAAQLASEYEQMAADHNQIRGEYKLKAMERMEPNNAKQPYYGESIQPTPKHPNGVYYFSAAERQKLRLHMNQNGRLVDVDDIPFDSGENTIDLKGDEVKNKSMFVMDENGQIYAYRAEDFPGKDLNHSSILAGKPVAAAGEMRVVNGIITSINNYSGHYSPAPSMTQQVFDSLKRQDPGFKVPPGVDESGTW